MTVEDLQEAFFNFDENKTGYVSIETLRILVTTDGEPLHDVSIRTREISLFPFSVLHTNTCSYLFLFI